jgi:hypothetical protein
MAQGIDPEFKPQYCKKKKKKKGLLKCQKEESDFLSFNFEISMYLYVLRSKILGSTNSVTR